MTDLNNWQSQLHKGFIELCILTLLSNKESYGGEILNSINAAGLNVQEGTLYPLLNRMQRNGWLESRWQTPEQQGHPRRYYTPSAASNKHLPEMQNSFLTLNNSYERIKGHD